MRFNLRVISFLAFSCSEESMSCCGDKKACNAPQSEADLFSSIATAAPESGTGPTRMHDVVKEYYGKVLTSTKDLKTSSCCTVERPHPLILEALKK